MFFLNFVKVSRKRLWFNVQLYSERGFGTGVFLWICEIFKDTFFYRTPPVAAFVDALHRFSFEEISEFKQNTFQGYFLGFVK